MKRGWLLLWLSVGLDLLGVLTGAALSALLRHHNLAQVLQLDGLVFGLALLLLAWFFGGYSFLRWPWMPYSQLLRRWWLVLAVALALSVFMEWLLKPSAEAVWSHRSTLFTLGVFLGIWGALMRRWLQPLARRQARARLATSPVVRARMNRQPVAETDSSEQLKLLLLVVAYHPSTLEVDQLQACLSELPPQVGYAVVVNDHVPGEPAERLEAQAVCFLTNPDNPGYGRAVNRLVVRLSQLPPYLGVLNTDLSWQLGTFEKLLSWLEEHPDVSLAVPQILDEAGKAQKLCKNNPTVLGLLSRRFLPDWLKPSWLKRYDRWYVMADQNYEEVFEASYLSGCCMLIRSDAFRRAGGFDERYFLYLEDADFTRTLARTGRCVHLPVAGVVHGWGRGNYRNLGLMAVNLASAWHYFRKWGWALW